MNELKLFIAQLGGKQPDDRLESHNLFFGIGIDFESLLPEIKKSWKGVKGLHVDSWICLDQIDGHRITITKRDPLSTAIIAEYPKLLSVNIGFYKRGSFGEQHRIYHVFLKDERESIRLKLPKYDPDLFKGFTTKQDDFHIDDHHDLRSAFGDIDIDDEINIIKELDRYHFSFTELQKSELRVPVIHSGFLFKNKLANFPES